MEAKTLVIGATGATGKWLVSQLLDRGRQVKVVVRSSNRLPEVLREHPNLSIIEASLLELTDQEMSDCVRDCSAVASCLGHNLSFRGLFGPPWRLVTDATRRLCEAIEANQPEEPVKFVLMNTTGVRNRDLDEPVSFAQRCVVGLLRLCLPPHADNENAADYLRKRNGRNERAWECVVVRPDGLIDEESVGEYELHASPIRSAIFDAGKTSRINVGHFMADLITSPEVWQQWRGRMPVIYDKG